MHAAAPALAANLPPVQITHVELFRAPTVDEAVPEEQSAHWAEPAATAYRPATHGTHAAPPEVANEAPGSHGLHSFEPSTGAYLPALHGAHAKPPATGE